MMTIEQHLLACLSEEGGELVMAVGKSLRFGMDSRRSPKSPNNKEDIEQELIDVMAVMEILEDKGMIDIKHLRRRMNEKKKKVMKHMHRRQDEGEVEPWTCGSL